MTQAATNIANDWRGTDQGTQLKPGGTSGLNIPLGGYRDTVGNFSSLSSIIILWFSSGTTGSIWDRGLALSLATMFRGTHSEAYVYSVRCLEN